MIESKEFIELIKKEIQKDYAKTFFLFRYGLEKEEFLDLVQQAIEDIEKENGTKFKIEKTEDVKDIFRRVKEEIWNKFEDEEIRIENSEIAFDFLKSYDPTLERSLELMQDYENAYSKWDVIKLATVFLREEMMEEVGILQLNSEQKVKKLLRENKREQEQNEENKIRLKL
jgi:hypothetical protein